MTFLWFLVFASSIGVTSVLFFFGLILKLLHPEAHQIKLDYSLEPSVSVLLPNFNEGEEVYNCIKSIRESNYPTDKLEIICVDDCSVDDSYEWMKKAEAEFPNIQVHRNPTNMGKNKTVLRALSFSKCDMVISIDSDTIFEKDTVRELMASFADPNMGAVGGVVGVRNVNDSAFTAFQTFQYFVAFYLGKISENWTQTVGCISGCLFAIRRDIYLQLHEKMEARHWFGMPTSEGEDRYLTHMVVLGGWGTYINTKARCWTTVPVTFKQYYMQQLRWRRSGLRDLFMTIRRLPDHVGINMSPMVLYVFLFFPLTTMLTLIRLGVAFLNDPLFWANPILLGSYLVIASLSTIVMKKYSPSQAIHNPLKLAMFGAWWIVNSLFLTILAICTLDYGDWGTRAKVPEPEKAPESSETEVETLKAESAHAG